MAHILKLNYPDPIIHLKAYGGVQLTGVEEQHVQCDIDSLELATLIEKDGNVYITVNASCSLEVPVSSSLVIERGMGSVQVANINNKITIDKVLGNLVLLSIDGAKIGKVGGNFSVKDASGLIQIEKVAGNLVVGEVGSFSCEKVGGNCYARGVKGDFSLGKGGGNFKGEDLRGETQVSKIGGDFLARGIDLRDNLSVGGEIALSDFRFADEIRLRAGGDIELSLTDAVNNARIAIRSGEGEIEIQTRDDRLEIFEGLYTYQLGNGDHHLEVAAGGKVLINDQSDEAENILGDLSEYFEFEESAFSELIQERIDAATRKAEAKVKSAEIRLEEIRERVEKQRGFDLNLDLDDPEGEVRPKPPAPPVIRPTGRKGVSDEERLMILKMLQDHQITVDEAETLFRAMED